MDYNQLSKIERKYWNIAYCDEIECAVGNDGLLFMFEVKDIQEILYKYPYNKKKHVWYFNKSRDREIAELVFPTNRIIVNPQFCCENFKDIIV